MFILDNGARVVIPRTEMTYPGHSMKLHQNAADPVKSPVDHVMADFEDACPYEFKGEKSRKVMVEALNTLDFGKKIVSVRPNNIRSPFFKDDMEAVVLGAPNRFHGIMLPKTRGPEEIHEVAALLDEVAALRRENVGLREENARLRKDLEEWKRGHRERWKRRSARAEGPREASGKKPGRKGGHTGAWRPVPKPDRREEHPMPRRCECGGAGCVSEVAVVGCVADGAGWIYGAD